MNHRSAKEATKGYTAPNKSLRTWSSHDVKEGIDRTSLEFFTRQTERIRRILQEKWRRSTFPVVFSTGNRSTSSLI
jgi:hypothetical protein